MTDGVKGKITGEERQEIEEGVEEMGGGMYERRRECEKTQEEKQQRNQMR